MSIRDSTHCYIGAKPCGCVVAAVVDAPELQKETAKSVAEFIRDGLQVDRVLVKDARVKLTSCKCNPEAKQGTLL